MSDVNLLPLLEVMARYPCMVPSGRYGRCVGAWAECAKCWLSVCTYFDSSTDSRTNLAVPIAEGRTIRGFKLPNPGVPI